MRREVILHCALNMRTLNDGAKLAGLATVGLKTTSAPVLVESVRVWETLVAAFPVNHCMPPKD
jgi:hypothetical protein